MVRYWVVVLCFFCVIPIKVKCQNVQPGSHVFDRVKRMPKTYRLDSTYIIYRFNCRKMKPEQAMKSLDQLLEIAHELNDKELEAAVFELHGDYYSVNTGFNATSTGYYQKAIDFANDNGQVIDVGIFLHKKGVYYYVYRHNVEACKYFLQSQDIFKRVGFDKVPNISVYLTQEANFYYDLGDYENAMWYLKESLKYPIEIARTKINTINTIGLIYRNDRRFDESLSYFNKALVISKANRDTAWAAITMGNIGSVFFMRKEYARALPFIETDYNISLKYNEKENAAHALLRLAKINLVNDNVKDAAKQLNETDTLIKNIYDGLKLRIEIYDLKAQLYERQGYLAKSIAYRKSMELAKDSLQQRNSIAAIERVKLNWEMGNHQLMIDRLKTEAEIGTLRRNAVIMGLVMMVIISLLIYNQQMIKVKKDKNLLISEKRLVDEELKNAESELLLYTESLKRKNVIIEYFRKEIARLEIQVINKDEAEHLEKMMQAHIMTDENWDEFKGLFAKVHTGFFSAIKKSFPGLSGTDTRILTLMKLQLSNREMANMLGITTDGIKKAKQRLRKKMNLPVETDIERTISTL
jgi:tetratricopeptide (TPR) repeat protein